MKKILVTGSEGMLGKALMRNLSSREVGLEGSDIRSKDNTADITDFNEMVGLLKRIKPDIVIHAAAYTDVDGCELNPDKAYQVNGEGTRNVAEACRNQKAFLVYLSTDFIFDGTKAGPYIEEDKPNPINIYGQSKLMGENFIKELLDDYLIIRTSWLFGKGGRNFVDTIMEKARIEKVLKVVNDQIGSPTYAVDLASVITQILLSPISYHLSPVHITNSGSCSRYELAKEILRIKGMEEVILEPATSEEISYPARRPKMSVLDNLRFEKIYGRKLASWQDALKRYLTTIPSPNRGRGLG